MFFHKRQWSIRATSSLGLFFLNFALFAILAKSIQNFKLSAITVYLIFMDSKNFEKKINKLYKMNFFHRFFLFIMLHAYTPILLAG
ncbi:MAG: hypothetical protein CK425_10625, partial [Parachlamydia sp.]